MDITIDSPQVQGTSAESAGSMPMFGFRVSLEALIYLGLFVFGAVLRLVGLGTTTLDERQSHEALAALHRVNSKLAGEAIIADSPLMALANQISFFLLDHSAISARLATALMGSLLILCPVLWRRYLGRTGSIVLAMLLTVSPIALASSRTMGAATWTMVLVFLGMWFVGEFADKKEKYQGIAATMMFGGVFLLTEPTGIITLLGLLVGLLFAVWLSRVQSVTQRTVNPLKTIDSTLKQWPWLDGLMATVVFILVVGTGFFTVPDGLSSVGNTFYLFVQGIAERAENMPSAFALLIALRYDFGIIVFGLIGLYFALREGDFFSRFLSGWFIWALVMGLLYAGATPDAGLWITVPAACLTTTLVVRMLRSAEIGHWVVPGWAIPVHAVCSLALIIAIVLNVVIVGRTVQRETAPRYYHQTEISPIAMDSVRIGTFDENAAENTFELIVTAPLATTLQLWRMDDSIQPIMCVVSDPAGRCFIDELTATQEQVQLHYERLLNGPYVYDPDNQGIVEQVNFTTPGTYYVRVIQAASENYQRGQFALLTHAENAEETGILGAFKGYKLDIPAIWVLLRSLSNQGQPSVPLMVIVFTFFLLVISFFLAGSLWGSRAAWRGVGFGFLLYFMTYGLGLGWQASVTFANDPRELWQVNPPLTKMNALVETLEQMSRFDKSTRGEKDKITITVQAPDDGALAWALRDFDNVEYVDGVGLEVATGAVIVPYDETDYVLGADYVGQDFILSETWHLSDLSWMDFISWLSVRETRFDPLIGDRYMLWVRKDVYGVREVTTE